MRCSSFFGFFCLFVFVLFFFEGGRRGGQGMAGEEVCVCVCVFGGGV